MYVYVHTASCLAGANTQFIARKPSLAVLHYVTTTPGRKDAREKSDKYLMSPGLRARRHVTYIYIYIYIGASDHRPSLPHQIALSVQTQYAGGGYNTGRGNGHWSRTQTTSSSAYIYSEDTETGLTMKASTQQQQRIRGVITVILSWTDFAQLELSHVI